MTTPDQPTSAEVAAMPTAELLRLAAQAAREDLDDMGDLAGDDDRALAAIFETAARAAGTDEVDDYRAVTAAVADIGRLVLLELVNELAQLGPAGSVS